MPNQMLRTFKRSPLRVVHDAHLSHRHRVASQPQAQTYIYVLAVHVVTLVKAFHASKHICLKRHKSTADPISYSMALRAICGPAELAFEQCQRSNERPGKVKRHAIGQALPGVCQCDPRHPGSRQGPRQRIEDMSNTMTEFFVCQNLAACFCSRASPELDIWIHDTKIRTGAQTKSVVMVCAKTLRPPILNKLHLVALPAAMFFWHVQGNDHFVNDASRCFCQLRQQSLHLFGMSMTDHRHSKQTWHTHLIQTNFVKATALRVQDNQIKVSFKNSPAASLAESNG